MATSVMAGIVQKSRAQMQRITTLFWRNSRSGAATCWRTWSHSTTTRLIRSLELRAVWKATGARRYCSSRRLERATLRLFSILACNEMQNSIQSIRAPLAASTTIPLSQSRPEGVSTPHRLPNRASHSCVKEPSEEPPESNSPMKTGTAAKDSSSSREFTTSEASRQEKRKMSRRSNK